MKYSWFLVFVFCFQLSASTQDSVIQVLRYMVAVSSAKLAVETTCPEVMVPLAVLTIVYSIHDAHDSWTPWILGSATWFGSVLWRSKDPRLSW